MIRRVSIPLLASLFFFALIHLGSGMNLLDRPQLKKNIEFAPPSITVSQCDITPSDRTATINAEIVVEGNRQLHYVVVDLASGGGGYYPTHSKLKEYEIGSRILAKGKDKILTLIEIYRSKTGVFDVTISNGIDEHHVTLGEGDVVEGVLNSTLGGGNIILDYRIGRSGEKIIINLAGDVYHKDIDSSTVLYLVTWACDWIDNEALSISDCPQARAYISPHKQLFASQLVLAEGLYSRVFTIGYRPYQCLDYVGIEFSSQDYVKHFYFLVIPKC